jgi:hypothetical protein
VGTSAGHGSILNVPGTDDWLLAYHRRQPGVTARDARVTCIDRIFFREDGTMEQVVLTQRCGLVLRSEGRRGLLVRQQRRAARLRHLLPVVWTVGRQTVGDRFPTPCRVITRTT